VGINAVTDLRNTDASQTAFTIRQNPVGGSTECHAVQITQSATAGGGAAVSVVSNNSTAPAIRTRAAGPLIQLYDASNTLRFEVGNTGALSSTGALVVSAVASPPVASTLPLGSTNAAANTGIQLVGSFAGGEDESAGTDSTPRINIYSYQRANTHSFGEIQRMWLMRKDSKAMLAWYGPQLTGTQTHGYDASRNALSSGVTWKPWAWLGAHYEANDHNSVHGHISIEVPDTTGALQTRFEIVFADRTTGAIGLTKAFINVNDSDFSVRQSSGEEMRIVAPAGTEKRITFSGDAFGSDAARRWKLRSTSTAESGSNAGSDFELLRYDDSGVAQSSTFIVKRSNGFTGFGAALSDITARITAKSDGTASAFLSSVTAEGTASVAVHRIETTTTGKRAFDYRLTNDSVSRIRIDASSGSGSGTVTFGDGTTADTNLYRSAANTLRTDDTLSVGAGLAVTGNSTLTGDLTLQGTGKAYRFRRSGSALDLDATGADLLISNFSGTAFDGTQRSYFRLSADAHNVQVAGKVEFVDALYGTTRHVLDGAANAIGFFGTAAAAKQSVAGSRGGNAALTSLLTALAAYGLITDGSSA
jgi:hypothetical protein